ncbi:von Willebrand factor A domain-containing protein 5A isoform X1 [Oncorhynchus tshawytscha]|uniref:von Willebrand factor A domain-containing protein 5A-like n=1 Tax=Oncorhynchus tshawytscha TaxID=74940 RepID=A0AAZ3RD64_ONCTS|nr:von Willebrand factor A domain-containing protein 5A isoform X1 [Oncorhynchus tshawytscha]XP_042153525.1 von Willebrand factor A domain-containing protein 5A isoform X1 [Oncorhynchus tshawytscha]
MVNCCGLVTVKNKPVPLKSIAVEVSVQGHVATVSSTLQYENQEESPLEAIFVFPLPGEAAVCRFSAKIGQTEVVAEVQEKQKAREQYDDLLSSGQQAFLLEESDESPDVFKLSVGSLPPGEKASISLDYVTELAVQADDGLRLCLPAVLNPRYQPQGSDSGSGGSALVSSVPTGSVPYSLSLSARVSSLHPICRIESNCPLDPLNYLNTEKTQATVSLAAGHQFDRDVELLLYYQDTHQPTAIVEAAQASAKPGSLMGDPVVMLSLYPEFPNDVMSSMTSLGEFLFVVDRSGSMSCPMHNESVAQDRIGSARDTLLLLLKSLPMGCYFNIIGFGSRYESFFTKSVEYSQKTMDEALQKVKAMRADLGGTEILQPLKHIYSQPCLPDQPRQLFLFTDGEVGNTKEVLDLVKANAGSHRCFSFGIGEGASSALISGVAKQGGGHSQFITGQDRMQPKVMQSLRFALQPAVVNISVKWNVPKGVSVTSLSPPIRVLFQGQRALLYAQLTGKSSGDTEGSVTVKYSLAEQPVENQLSFSLKPAEDTGLTVHRLGARTLIRSLEMEERQGDGKKKGVQEKVVELSVQSGVSSVFTAFIAVHKVDGEAVQGPMLRRQVPTPSVCGYAKQQRRSLRGAAMNRSMLTKMCCDVQAVMGPRGLRSNFRKMSKLQSEDLDCPATASNPVKDPLLQLISLQKASGSWVLEAALAEVLGKTEEEVAKPKPAQVDQEVWATVLALVWLYGFKMEAQEEWQFLAMKAVSWIQAQKAASVSECVKAGNILLGCQVQKDTLGL